jgi:hypothetical protein
MISALGSAQSPSGTSLESWFLLNPMVIQVK